MSKRAIMSQAEVLRFTERVYSDWHPHAWEDHMKDVAFYVLDLLRQGYTVQGVLERLKRCIDIARAQHGTLHTDLLVQFRRAIRRCRVTERWVWFHLSSPGSTESSSRVIRATGERAEPSIHFRVAGFLTDQIEKGACG